MCDERFHAPMITCEIGQIFVNDFIKLSMDQGLAKVKMFFKKVVPFFIIGQSFNAFVH